MTKKQIYKQAIKDYEKACELFNGKDYQDCVEICYKEHINLFNLDDDLFDIDFGTCVFTITNEEGKGHVCENSIDVWNDHAGYVLEQCTTIETIRGYAQ